MAGELLLGKDKVVVSPTRWTPIVKAIPADLTSMVTPKDPVLRGTSGGIGAQGVVPMDIGMIRPEAYGQMSSVQPYAGIARVARVSALEVISSPCKAAQPSHGMPSQSTDDQEIREKLLKADFTTEQAEAPHDIDPQIWKAFLGECGMTVGDSVFYPSMFFQEKMAKDLLNAVYPTVAYITTPPPSWASQGDISKPGFNLTNDLEEALVSDRKRMRKVDRPFFLGKLWTCNVHREFRGLPPPSYAGI